MSEVTTGQIVVDVPRPAPPAEWPERWCVQYWVHVSRSRWDVALTEFQSREDASRWVKYRGGRIVRIPASGGGQ